MASSVGLLALLSSISTVESREEFTTTDILQHRQRHNVVDEHATNKKFILPTKLMQTQHRLARLLEKRRFLNQEVDVGIISSTVSSSNNTSSDWPTYSPTAGVPDRTQVVDVTATSSSETSSYSVSVGSITSTELIEQCLNSCPDSALCKCLGDEPPFGCYTGGYSEEFCTDSKVCLPDNEASLFSAYLCPQNRCIANIDGIEKVVEYATNGVEEDIIMNMSTAEYEQMINAGISMRACSYCVGRKSLCGTCKEDENFCNTVWQTSVYCKEDNCTLAQMKTVSDICLPEPCGYFYGQFINCEDFPELRVENYASTDDKNKNDNSEEDGSGNVSTTSSSNKAVIGGSAAALTTILSIGFSH